MGSIQQAVGYAKDLDRSLTDIRIVTGASSDQMASFAKEANRAAKALNATTTDYTKASLIYYQQGLNEADVKARTETTIKMANVTGTTAQKVSEQMTAVWNNYDDGSKSLTYYADVMTALGAATASSTDEIAQGLQKFASISNTVGLSYEYASAALATITSTSRESADVVGNALKTLFSRIQGLQLGETLEDGTTLNKYSSALAKIGINIKDASGQMKDMDAILDEMGMTWQTLARDEKMALAQTVAGVRQYTQLMTLMENWNSFKANVQIAEDSEGTLDTQASIYAESWEAASNRVRASWESLWDNLIDSDSFISILNFLSSLIDMTDSLVTGFGGAGGVLSTFGGILTKTFSPQIAKTIKDAAYSLKMMMPGAMEKAGQERASIVKSMRDTLASGTFEISNKESTVLRQNLAAMAEESSMRDIRYANMNAQERIEAAQVEARLQQIRKEKVETASQIGLAAGNVVDLKDVMDASGQSLSEILVDKNARRIQEITDEVDEARKKHKKPKSGKSITDLEKEKADLIANNNIPAWSGKSSRETVYGDAAKAASQFKSQFNKGFWDNIGANDVVDTKKAKQSIKNLLTQHPLLKFDEKMIDDAFAGMTGSDNQNRAAIRKLIDSIITDSFTALSSSGEVSPEAQARAMEYMQNKYQLDFNEDKLGVQETAEQQGRKFLSEFDQPKPDKMTGAINAAEGAMFALGLAQSAQAAGEALVDLANNAGSVGDVFSSIIGSASNFVLGMSSISMALTNLAPAFAKSTTSILGATMSNAGWIGLAIMAVTAITSAIIGGLEAEKEAQIERHKKTLEETDAAQERLDKNKDLVHSMTDNISAYKQSAEAYQSGTGSAEDKQAAHRELINHIQSSGEDYSAEVVTATLLGDMDAAEQAVYQDRAEVLESESGQIGLGAEAATKLLTSGMSNVISGPGWIADNASLVAHGALSNYMGFIDGTERTGSGYELTDAALEDPEQLVQIYDQMKIGLRYLAAEGYSNTDYYRELESWINNNAENIENYKKYQQQNADLQAEKAAIDNEFYKVDNLTDYNALRNDLINANQDIAGFEESLDSYLNTLPNLINATAGNLPAIYTALEGIQESTKQSGLKDGLSMDTLIDMYDAMGNQLFNIDFENMSVDMLTQLHQVVTDLSAQGTEVTFEAILNTAGLMPALASALEQAQLFADQNTIQINIETVQSFNPEEDMYNATERNKFVKSYNELMGYEKGDSGYITSDMMNMMTESDIEKMIFESSQRGKRQQIDSASDRYNDQMSLNHQLTTELEAAQQAEAQGRQDAVAKWDAVAKEKGYSVSGDTVLQYFDELSEYEQLLRTEALDGLNETQLARKQELDGILTSAGLMGEGVGVDLLNSVYKGDWSELRTLQEETILAQNRLATGQNNLLSIQQEMNNAQLDRQAMLAEEAAMKGIDFSDVIEMGNQYLAQSGFEYDPNMTEAQRSTIIDQAAVDMYGRPIGLSTEQRDAAERVADGRIAEQSSQIEAAQRRAIAELETQEGIDELAKSYDGLSKSLRNSTKHSTEWNSAMIAMKKSLAKILNIDDWTTLSDDFVDAAESAGLLKKAADGDAKAISDLREQNILLNEAMEQGLLTEEQLAGMSYDEIVNATSGAFAGASSELQTWASDLTSVMDSIEGVNVGELINGDAELTSKMMNVLDGMGAFSGDLGALMDACSQLGITPEIVGPFSSVSEATMAGFDGAQIFEGDPEKSYTVTNAVGDASTTVSGEGNFFGVRFTKNGGGGGSGGGGGGGGGGEPKKVANKRKSQTVKRYKKNDMRRSSAQSAKKSASTQKDYLYGESKIAQMEKINKLAAKEAAITSDRIKESRKYMIEDRENLIKYMQKYGYEAEFDSDGFLNTYEEAWGKIHDKIAKLYEDNELTEDESKLEEDYKVELEELNGALEDYENSLKEMQSDIEAYEESLYEMYDNKVEQMQHKVEFKIELNEDDLSYLDFWIEALGDSLYNALESLQTMGAKTNVLFDGISTYKQGIEDIYALSDDPFQAWATGGLDDVLTQDQVDALRENRDGLMDYMQQLLDLRQTMQDKVLDVFDKWQEKLSNTMSTIEHYGSVIEHFRNIMDVVGKDALGLDDQFMARFEQSAIDQSMDNIDATKAHYESLVSQNEEAQRRLAEARARGDKASEEHWQGVVDSTTEAMQSAQDSLLSSLESTLDMIASQFESAMTRAVEAFNDAIYEHGGLSGLSEDYSFMREQSELMAEDYDKIYQLSKLNRNINKTLSDTNIIAGKQKMKSLQQEINELQASGVELSKYDLDYLQAKYELRLAEIELENAKNAKDTVRLSKDSEGNWSYIYTSSTDKVDEAQQKYEDALYAMQNLSYEYMEEMSNGMMQTSLAMMEKIQSLRIQDFDSYEAYAAEVKRIQDQYAGSLQNQQNELDKSMMNNQDLYNQDWQAYSEMTGYKISAAQDWADNFSETTLGALMGSESSTSDFADTVFGLSNTLSNDLGTAAMSYFTNVETAMNKYGTSINGFGSTVTTTVGNISTKSKAAANDMRTMAEEMNDAFTDITESVANWQKEFSGQIDSMLKEIGALVQSINEAIQKSAEMTGTKQVGDLIGSAEAAELLSNHEEYDFGDWKMDGSQLKVKGANDKDYAATTFVEENAKLINEINETLLKYTEAKTGSEERATLGAKLEELFKKYHAFKDIVSRVYDPTTLSALQLDNPNYASMDTGGYTGEWGDSGKFAMLHEKELVLNQDDTKNFLDALSISRDVLHSMIEMNAKQSSLALGDLYPSSIQDMSQMLEQQVSISAEFPNATERSEIEDAFNSLINTASQYANRYR